MVYAVILQIHNMYGSIFITRITHKIILNFTLVEVNATQH